MADLLEDDRLFATCGERTGIGTSEVNALLFRNPSGSGRIVKPRLMVYNNTATVNSFIRFRVYIDATVTAAGTGLTESALDIGSGNTAGAEVFTSPTTSANGTIFLELSAPGNNASADQKVEFPDGFQLRENHNLLVTAISDGTNRTAHVCFFWEED